MAKKKRFVYTISIPDASKVEMLRIVLAYEGAVRGLKMGQVIVDLLLEAIDLDDYPDELRDVISGLEKRWKSDATSEAIGRLAVGKSA